VGAIGPHLNRFAAHLTPGTASRVGVLYESLKRSDEYSGALSVVYIIVFVAMMFASVVRQADDGRNGEITSAQ
jgi:hypothetical protein